MEDDPDVVITVDSGTLLKYFFVAPFILVIRFWNTNKSERKTPYLGR